MKFFNFIVLVFALTTISSCVEKGCTDPEALNYKANAQRDDESCAYGDKYKDEKAEVILNYSNMAFAMYSDAHSFAVGLQTNVDSFVNNPTDDGFSACRLAWQTAYYYYAQCAPLRFSSGPIDSDPNYHLLLGTWPIRPSIVDYAKDGDGGIVGNEELFPVINGNTLQAENGVGNIVTGFHVMEFLLWGEDVDDPDDITVGYRTFEDYADTTSNLADRRKDYLKAVSDLLVTHLAIMKNEWRETGVGNYRASFIAQDENESMKQILTGLGTLCRAEMAERAMTEPKLKGIEEYEISAYSDNSAYDLVAMNNGMEAIVTGIYAGPAGTVEGRSLIDLANLLDSELGVLMSDQIEKNREAIEAIPIPFDYQVNQEAVFGPGRIAEAVIELEGFEDLIFELAREMDFGLDTDLPEQQN